MTMSELLRENNASSYFMDAFSLSPSLEGIQVKKILLEPAQKIPPRLGDQRE